MQFIHRYLSHSRALSCVRERACVRERERACALASAVQAHAPIPPMIAQICTKKCASGRCSSTECGRSARAHLIANLLEVAVGCADKSVL